MSERDLRQKEIQTYNPYNTRGPNMNGKLYTTKTNAEHNALIKELKAKGLWFVYQ